MAVTGNIYTYHKQPPKSIYPYNMEYFFSTYTFSSCCLPSVSLCLYFPQSNHVPGKQGLRIPKVMQQVAKSVRLTDLLQILELFKHMPGLCEGVREYLVLYLGELDDGVSEEPDSHCLDSLAIFRLNK